jgi:hypothetical protein
LERSDERQLEGLPGLVARVGAGRSVDDAFQQNARVGLKPGRLANVGRFGCVEREVEREWWSAPGVMVFPVVLGAGECLFGETSDKKPMRLPDTRTVGDGVAHLCYEFICDA